MNWIKFIFNKKYRKQFLISDIKCTCGKYKKCIREVRVKDNGYWGVSTLYVRKQDHFGCGRIQNKIKQIKNSMIK